MDGASVRSLWGQINMDGAILVESDQHGKCDPEILVGSDQHGRCDPGILVESDQHGKCDPEILVGSDQHGRCDPAILVESDQQGKCNPVILVGSDQHGRCDRAILVGSDQHGRCDPAILVGSDQHGRCERSESVAQSRITRSRKPKHDQSSVVTKWMGDFYMLDFAPALRFLRSQILYRLHKSPSDEAINRGPPCACTRNAIPYTRWISCSPCQCSANSGNAKIIQHALKVSRVFKMLKLDTIRKNKTGMRRCERAIFVQSGQHRQRERAMM